MAEKLDILIEGVNRLQKPLKEMADGLEKFYRQVSGQSGTVTDNMTNMARSIGGLATSFGGAGGLATRIGAAGGVATAAVGVFAAMAYAVGKYSSSYASLERLSKTTGAPINFLEAFKAQTEAMKLDDGLQIIESMSEFVNRLRRFEESAVQEIMKVPGEGPHELMRMIQRGSPNQQVFTKLMEVISSVHDEDKNLIMEAVAKRRDALAILQAYKGAQESAPKFVTTPEEHQAMLDIHEKWIAIQVKWYEFMNRLEKSSAPAWLPVFEVMLKSLSYAVNALEQGPRDYYQEFLQREREKAAAGKRSSLRERSLLNQLAAALSVGSAAAAEAPRSWTADRDDIEGMLGSSGRYAGFRGGGFGRNVGGGGVRGGEDAGPPALNAPTSPENAPTSYGEQPGLAPLVGGNEFLAGKRKQFAEQLKDPTTRNWVGAVLSAENVGAGPAVVESLFNRLEFINEKRAREGKPLMSVMQMIRSGFYGPVNNGAINSHLQRMTNDPAYAARMNRLINQALGGSNVTRSHTDQGSRGDPNYEAGGIGVNINGERFNDWGVPGSREWRLRREREIGATGNAPSGSPVSTRTMTIEEIGRAVRRGEAFEGNERFSRLRGNIGGVRPELIATLTAASRDLPPGYTVEMVSGNDWRERTTNHPNGLAMDVQIRDPQGNVLSNAGFGPGMKVYEKLFQAITLRGASMFPNQRFIWGGGWIGRAAGYGDRMHFQIVDPRVGGSSQSSGGGYDPRTGAPGDSQFAQSLMSPSEREEFRAGVRQNIAGGGSGHSVGVDVSVKGPPGTDVQVKPDSDIFNVHKLNRIIRSHAKPELEAAED